MVVIQGQLFIRLRPNYERSGALKLKIQYRRRYFDTQLIKGEECAEVVKQDHDQARAETGQDYIEASAEVLAARP